MSTGSSALFLIDEGMAGAGLKEEGGDQEALGGCRTERAMNINVCRKVHVRVVEAGKVVDMRLDAFRDDRFQHMVELLFYLDLIVSERQLPPAEGFLASH